MESVLGVLRWIHIGAGSVGLIVYWIPVFSRKGGGAHKRFGRIFKWTAYAVLAAAAAAISLRLLGAALNGVGPADEPAQFAFILFLGYLTVVTWVMLRHGIRVLEHKRDVTDMDGPWDRGLARLAIGVSAAIVLYALYFAPPNRVMLFAMSPIGVLIGKGILDALNGRHEGKNAWLLEHLGAMLGAGIAFHTAFAVFGMTRLFDLGITGWVATVPWVLPALVGVPASALWSRKYQRRTPQPQPTA